MSETSKLIQGRTGPWEIVLGLEVHAQVASNAKLFSGAAVGFGAGPNAQVSLVDAAMPGMLPVLNRYCVEQAVRTGLGLKAKINLVSRFDRKNYFYPDLPQGYQISQYKDPIVGEGEVLVERDDGSTFTVGIERLHLEQDAGKSLHDQDPNATYVDLNRAGTALMEIVSRPDMRSAEEAAAYVKKLRTILVYLGSCDGDMEKGNLRADVNVSVRRPGADLGTRCEIKNVNSYRFIQQAIEYEARRQIEILEEGGVIDQETRLFDPVKGETRSMRSKEDAHDYRYFPDPDLLPLELDPAWVKAIEDSLPELPDAKKARFQSQYGLTAYDAGVLISEQARADFYEAAARGRDAKLVANWVTNDLAARLTAAGTPISESPIAPDEIAELVALIEEGVISSKIAKDVFERMWAGEGRPRAIVEAQGLQQVSDTGALEALVDQLIADNPGQAAAVREKPQAIGWFVGQVMKATGGKANPGAVNQILKAKLGL
ncbi:MAG: Asp-tRNA(Asn)/Glu-tRNA(Gln) amidotransferase subunit GatB [Phenylobacterium sp.]|jgi:aspartyl-tRNA(Asn)/glutamyl-tRNA(Gln) amidotransferase subunit B|uniref:Asp-tRNA(Asn)/Glu-tRNA(Gln) amidotransferase subunit GatB n=1 Tax=Phenylobacterium sp. TaxID=1871053 RepID=UPI0025D01B86|nr:Asp-tRNA(Asn)/Glu-tRNA(Gln) amidotransferase subunit GatB [Phenylobacterium sp.]MCA3723220.1 Asp-tRNA(Asn)/Glu-tRNA(Gln) amidotransferase subunit GatB [Phenylobacterium sp.]MCA3733087.1 Asp-tRNA(Asn)/Glu-tRNA(Gln) amidotransferase subunit GatB [Phenylobacterium sp.]MCA6261586.1 Asp-tRNA(Asn)/Glu-tRNA(Gln) amidotransferase subunit GatB [Phenylobacterium sp.]MCA6333031.1 Asp-tRNA(Asn)/Glu-tRNA(Gln) amidotransferase subunit GatB [Phenylobacterium sp.]MCE2819805.1 Asp-tRNA(Asn)/Glu-tRNA(Gln) am